MRKTWIQFIATPIKMKLIKTYCTITLLLLFNCSFGDEIVAVKDGLSGTGTTTRYWDCCETACSAAATVQACAADGVTPVPLQESGCAGGNAFSCSNQQAWVINSTLAYGFAAASFTGGIDTNLCCACFLLSFTDQIIGKKMLVQNTNTGSPLQVNQFDIAIPGGGLGIFQDGCTAQWGTSKEVWQVDTKEQCYNLPEPLQPGCLFRFDFMEGASNPGIEFVQVECPSELVEKSGCSYNS